MSKYPIFKWFYLQIILIFSSIYQLVRSFNLDRPIVYSLPYTVPFSLDKWEKEERAVKRFRLKDSNHWYHLFIHVTCVSFSVAPIIYLSFSFAPIIYLSISVAPIIYLSIYVAPIIYLSISVAPIKYLSFKGFILSSIRFKCSDIVRLCKRT